MNLKPYLLPLLIVFLTAVPLVAQQKDTVRVGIFVNSLYDFNFQDRSFVADFWIWYNYRNDSLKVMDNTEITNAKGYNFSYQSTEKIRDVNWASQKCKGSFKKTWNVVKFPFDRQELTMKIEEADKDTSELVYTADTLNSKLSSDLNLLEWDVERFSLKPGTTTYNTSYGNPELTGTSSYASVTATIVVRRSHSWVIFMKMVTGVYVAFIISALVFFISPVNTDLRFTLCVGGLFASIGNKYIVESIVPSTTANTLIDTIHNLTFISILVIILISIISLRYHEKNRMTTSKRLDRYSFVAITAIFTLINVVIILGSLQSEF